MRRVPRDRRGIGRRRPPPLTGLASRWTVDGLVAFLAAPTPPMPAVERSEADRHDLAVHRLSAHH
jgi:hypothetical protein